jgi:hypothetical protein
MTYLIGIGIAALTGGPGPALDLTAFDDQVKVGTLSYREDCMVQPRNQSKLVHNANVVKMCCRSKTEWLERISVRQEGSPLSAWVSFRDGDDVISVNAGDKWVTIASVASAAVPSEMGLFDGPRLAIGRGLSSLPGWKLRGLKGSAGNQNSQFNAVFGGNPLLPQSVTCIYQAFTIRWDYHGWRKVRGVWLPKTAHIHFAYRAGRAPRPSDQTYTFEDYDPQPPTPDQLRVPWLLHGCVVMDSRVDPGVSYGPDQLFKQNGGRGDLTLDQLKGLSMAQSQRLRTLRGGK